MQICRKPKKPCSKQLTVNYQRIWDRNLNQIQDQVIRLWRARNTPVAAEEVEHREEDNSDVERDELQKEKAHATNVITNEIRIPALDDHCITSTFEKEHPTIFEEEDACEKVAEKDEKEKEKGSNGEIEEKVNSALGTHFYTSTFREDDPSISEEEDGGKKEGNE